MRRADQTPDVTGEHGKPIARRLQYLQHLVAGFCPAVVRLILLTAYKPMPQMYVALAFAVMLSRTCQSR